MALNISILEEKRVFFDEALDILEESAVTFLDNARKFSKDPHDPMNSEYQRLTLESGKEFSSGVTRLIQVCPVKRSLYRYENSRLQLQVGRLFLILSLSQTKNIQIQSVEFLIQIT